MIAKFEIIVNKNRSLLTKELSNAVTKLVNEGKVKYTSVSYEFSSTFNPITFEKEYSCLYMWVEEDG